MDLILHCRNYAKINEDNEEVRSIEEERQRLQERYAAMETQHKKSMASGQEDYESLLKDVIYSFFNFFIFLSRYIYCGFAHGQIGHSGQELKRLSIKLSVTVA